MESDPTHPEVEITGPPPPPPFTKISSYNTRWLTKLGGPPPPPPPMRWPMHKTPEPVLRDLAGLSKEKWVKVIEPMAEEYARKLIPKVHGWNLISENGLSKLKKSWLVASIPNLWKMLKIIGHVKEDRHLEIKIVGWNLVTIWIWTPGVGGLTKNDFILAAKINAIDMEHLMRPKYRRFV